MVTFDDFQKLELKIGTVLSAEKVEGADRLLKLEVDLGAEKRQVVAGVAQVYGPEDLVGKQVPILVNVEPRKIMGVESRGMILCTVDGESPVLMHPVREVPPGALIR